jgi:hypothetical protein
VARLQQTTPANLDEILTELQLEPTSTRSTPRRFHVADPYHAALASRVSEAVEQSRETVCAVKFLDDPRTGYTLKTFPSRRRALSKGYIITHTNHCGACSTLQDLAVYIEKPDLTAPTRRCAKMLGLQRSADCMQEVGFTRACAEVWAYNGKNTRSQCLGRCVREYGLWNILRGRYESDNQEDGSLNDCLLCDETESGPGFKYGAGRTRRNSGLRSSIQRGEDEISDVDHSLYFE